MPAHVCHWKALGLLFVGKANGGFLHDKVAENRDYHYPPFKNTFYDQGKFLSMRTKDIESVAMMKTNHQSFTSAERKMMAESKGLSKLACVLVYIYLRGSC